MSFEILDAAGTAVTDFATEHDKQLHLIVVRADGTHFRHVHPERGADGAWSIPWQWEAAGTYRVFADFVPAEDDVAVERLRGAGAIVIGKTNVPGFGLGSTPSTKSSAPPSTPTTSPNPPADRAAARPAPLKRPASRPVRRR